jgi:hypothetical protein
MKTYRFYKDDSGWFIDLPEWKGEKWELQMVMGADKFCDIMSEGKSEISVTLSKEPFDGSETLQFQELGRLEGPEYGEGSWYFLQEYQENQVGLKMWLCDVTKFIFGDFPQKIYFK